MNRIFRCLPRVAGLGLAVSMLGIATPAAAQPATAQYPSKPLRFIVPYIPGSAPDVIARTTGEALGRALGQPLVIENRGGAGGNIGAEYAARQPNDGYTLVLLTSSNVSNKFLYKQIGYEVATDFAPVSLIARLPSLLVVPAASPANSVRELIALAKKDPGKLSYASGGVGSLAHLSGSTFAKEAGIEVLHVPYKGAPEIIRSLLSAENSMGFPTFPTAYPQVGSGKLKGLAVTGSKRNPKLPEIPTMLESMSPGFEIDAWFGIFVPAGTPAEIVRRLNASVVRLAADPVFVDKVSADGTEVVSSSPEEFQAYIRTELVKWEKIIRDSGARAD